MKIRISKMADGFIFGIQLMKGVLIVNLPYRDIWIMTTRYYLKNFGDMLEEEEKKKFFLVEEW